MKELVLRLVSLCPSITETIFALGRGLDLVGITKFCIKPRGAVAGILKVGGTKNPDIARIEALRPDLVFLNREENRREDGEALRAAGLICHDSCPTNAAEAAETLLSIGAALGALACARDLAQAIQDARLSVRTRTRGRRAPGFAYLIWRKPWMAAGPHTYIDGLLSEAGGRNLFATAKIAYPEISAAQLATGNPDLILLASEPFPFKDRHIAELVEVTGLDARRFRLVDGELLSWHGVRTASGLRYASELLHGPNP